MNKVEKYPNLEQWCKDYHEKSGLKVHPSSVPVDVVLDELMGNFINLAHNQDKVGRILEFLTNNVLTLEQKLSQLTQETLNEKKPKVKK